MRRPLTIIAASGFMLASCSSTSIADIVAQIAAVQKSAMQICGFLPYATTIANIIGKNITGLKTSIEIAQSICDAMKPKSGAKLDSLSPPKLGDVQVEGEFVAPKE